MATTESSATSAPTRGDRFRVRTAQLEDTPGPSCAGKFTYATYWCRRAASDALHRGRLTAACQRPEAIAPGGGEPRPGFGYPHLDWPGSRIAGTSGLAEHSRI